ncbi:MAG TPA: histidine kinase, partial [Candidatus Sulfotelmatobacter sp.]|nr:histidine kinase [Candidatus Sulfotelmatobacter sp.]
RVFLAGATLVAIRMDPTELLGHSWAAYGLFVFYLANGILILMLLKRRQQSTAAFRFLVHAGDIAWPAVISIFAEGPRTPFFLFFFFVLASAAYRWGFRGTLLTAAAEALLLWIESFVVLHVWPTGSVPLRAFTGLRINVSEFEPQRLFMLSIYLIVMGLLLGYLAEQQKKLRAEKALLTGILSRVRVEAGLTGTMEQISREIVTMYGASRLMVAFQEIHSKRIFVGELNEATGSEFRWVESGSRDAKTYLENYPGEVSYSSMQKGQWNILALDVFGHPEPVTNEDGPSELRKLQSFDSMITVSFHETDWDWRGRVFILDPSWRGEKQEELRFLRDLVRQVGPAIYNVYLLHRLRRRTMAAERARFARELHDGAVQSLIAVEMQVDVLRRQAEAKLPISGELGRIQGLLREEVLKLRELMQQMKAIDVDSQKLLSVLRDTVERFQRETGINARFVTDLDQDQLEMPQRVCREFFCIVQEGLVNVRKHSGARHVLVRLGSIAEKWNLTLEDDGKGFPFSGRYNESQMQEAGIGPMIIRERVRLIAGELTVESNPGQGTRLEVSVPRNGDVPHAL